MLRLTLFILTVIVTSCTTLESTELGPDFPTQGTLQKLVAREDVEIYQKKRVLEFVGGKRRRCYVCTNSNSVMVVTETWKDAYPASFQILVSGRQPASGVYQFQEVESDRLTAVGIDVDLLLKIQGASLSMGMGTPAGSGPLFLVTVRPDKIKEFETIMHQIPTKKPSELSELSRRK